MRSASTTVPPAGRNRPRNGALQIGLALAATLLAWPHAAVAADHTVTVLLDRAQIMPYPATTETVIVGNPIIADVTMLRNTGQVILTGKGFGDTNLLFLDGRGKLLSESRIRVREAPGVMVVQRGADRETYACQPRCEPTVALGDSYDFLANSVKGVKLRNGLASGAAASANAPGQ